MDKSMKNFKRGESLNGEMAVRYRETYTRSKFELLIRTALFSIIVALVSTSTVSAQGGTANARRAFNQGNTLYKKGDRQSLNQALIRFGEAYRLYSNARKKDDMALSKVFLGRTHKKLGDLSSALRAYQEANTLYVEIADRTGEAAMNNNIAALFRDVGQFNEAIGYYKRALTLVLRTKGNPTGKARIYSGLADSYRGIGRFNDAVANYRKSITIWRALTSNDDKIRAHYGLALAYFALGDRQNSAKFENQALQMARRMKDPSIYVETLESLGSVYDEAGDKKAAVEYRIKALDAYKRAPAGSVPEDQWDRVVNNLADLYYRMGDLDTSYRILTGNIRPGVRGNEYPSQSYMVGTLGEVLTAQGRQKEAITAFNRAIELARQASDQRSEAYSYASLGMAYMSGFSNDPQKYVDAKSSFEKALSFFKPGVEDLVIEGKALAGMIAVYAFTGNQNMTVATIKKAEPRISSAANSLPAIQILHAIGIANAQFGQHAQAIRYYDRANSIARSRNNAIESAFLAYSRGFSYLQTSDYGNAMTSFQLAADSQRAFGNKMVEANAHIQLGWAALNSRNPDKALANAEKAAEVAGKVNDLAFKTFVGLNVFHIAGKAYFAKGAYQDALVAIGEALKIAERINDKPAQKHFLTDISETYQASGNKKEAKKYKKMADKIR
jgi:tetratricopeptide (TPR) repeat protein